MTSVVYAVPTPVPQPPVNPWRGMTHRWTGWDGSVWSLTDRGSGVRLKAGVRGLAMPPFSRYTSSSPAVAGSRNRGSRAAEREVFWPLTIYGDAGSAAWAEHDAAFWRTMHPRKPGQWAVTGPSGQTRTLRCRFTGDGNAPFDTDPALIGWAPYSVYLVAEDPFWRGAVVRRSWSVGTLTDFFDSAGSPPFTISDASLTAGATVTNPGDEDAWAVWTVAGPTTAFQATVDSGTTGLSVDVPAGQTVVINTDPTVQTASMLPTSLLEGLDPADLSTVASSVTDVTASLSPADFRPIPAGTDVALDITVDTTGSVGVQFTPLYHRAW